MSQVERALELALEALVSVELVKTETSVYIIEDACAWCEAVGEWDKPVQHAIDCARHAAIVAIHEARVEMNTQEATLRRDIEKAMGGI